MTRPGETLRALRKDVLFSLGKIRVNGILQPRAGSTAICLRQQSSREWIVEAAVAEKSRVFSSPGCILHPGRKMLNA